MAEPREPVAEVRDLEPTTEEALLLQLACDSCRINADPDADGHVDVVGGGTDVRREAR